MVLDEVRASSLKSTGVRILLVDDTSIIAERLSEALGAIEGVSIVGICQDSAQAICDIARFSPNVVILDIQLRESNGWDVLQSITHTNPETQVFVFSNNNDETARAKFMAGGANRFFDKSHDFEALYQAVNEMVENDRSN